MYIITLKETDEIIDFGNLLEYMDNGYPLLAEENICFPPHMVNVFKEDIQIDKTFVGKFCYTSEKGFFENTNYKEPSVYDMVPPNVLEAIIDQYNLDLIEQGVL